MCDVHCVCGIYTMLTSNFIVLKNVAQSNVTSITFICLFYVDYEIIPQFQVSVSCNLHIQVVFCLTWRI